LYFLIRCAIASSYRSCSVIAAVVPCADGKSASLLSFSSPYRLTASANAGSFKSELLTPNFEYASDCPRYSAITAAGDSSVVPFHTPVGSLHGAFSFMNSPSFLNSFSGVFLNISFLSSSVVALHPSVLESLVVSPLLSSCSNNLPKFAAIDVCVSPIPSARYDLT